MTVKREPGPEAGMPMTPSEAGAPWFAPMLNILRMEQNRGFDDRSVIGGLDGFTSHWAQEIIGQTANVRLVRRLLGASYRDLSPDQRAKWTGEWLTLLSPDGKESPPVDEVKSAPARPAARKAKSPEPPPENTSKTPSAPKRRGGPQLQVR